MYLSIFETNSVFTIMKSQCKVLLIGYTFGVTYIAVHVYVDVNQFGAWERACFRTLSLLQRMLYICLGRVWMYAG